MKLYYWMSAIPSPAASARTADLSIYMPPIHPLFRNGSVGFAIFLFSNYPHFRCGSNLPSGMPHRTISAEGRTLNSENIYISKKLSYILRHNAPNEKGIVISTDGFVKVSAVVRPVDYLSKSKISHCEY